MFSLIAAVGKNYELGNKGKLIFKIKEDMRFFKETTLGHKVVMGRKTWESLPHKLPGRENLVVSSHEVPGTDGVVHDLTQFIRDHVNSPEEIFVIGGATIYEQFLPFAKILYLTEVDEAAEADAFFPVFNHELYRREVLTKGTENDLGYAFVKYTLK